MNAPQRQDFANQLTKLKNSIPRYGKLVVAKVDATRDSLLVPVITRCNPGTAKDETSTTGNPEALQKQWDETGDDCEDRVSKIERQLEAIESQRGPDVWTPEQLGMAGAVVTSCLNMASASCQFFAAIAASPNKPSR